MSIRGIVEFAALIASQGYQIIESPRPISQTALQETWAASRDWLVQLMRELDELTAAAGALPPTERAELWPRFETALNQIFATEMLIRVLGGVFAARKNEPGGEEDAVVARNMLILQLQARQRALMVLVDGPACARGDIARVDRLRRKIERWTDMLLGPLVFRYEVEEFAFEAQRAREFGQDDFENDGPGNRQCTWQLLLAGLRTSFPDEEHPSAAPHPWPEVLCNAALRCLPVDASYADGPFRGTLATRIIRSGLKPEKSPSREILAAFRRPLTGLLTPVPSAQPGISFAKLRREQRSDD